MSPEYKKLGWALGLAAGAATVVGAILLWPKKASAQTPPQKGYVQYTSSWSSPVFPAKIGDTLTVQVPSLKGTDYMWHVVDQTGTAQAATIANNDAQDPGEIHIKFNAPGSGTIWIQKVSISKPSTYVEPPMAVNISVS